MFIPERVILMSTVIHLSWEYPPWSVGDLSRRLKFLLPALNDLVPLAFVVRADKDELIKMDGINVHKVGMSIMTFPNFIAYSHALNIELARGGANAIHNDPKIKLIHTHDWISSIAGVYLAAYFRLPLIISVYSTELTRARPPLNAVSKGIYDLERYCFQKAVALIVESAEMKSHLAELYKLTDKATVCADPALIQELYRRWLV